MWRSVCETFLQMNLDDSNVWPVQIWQQNNCPKPYMAAWISEANMTWHCVRIVFNMARWGRTISPPQLPPRPHKSTHPPANGHVFGLSNPFVENKKRWTLCLSMIFPETNTHEHFITYGWLLVQDRPRLKMECRAKLAGRVCFVSTRQIHKSIYQDSKKIQQKKQLEDPCSCSSMRCFL